MPAIPDFEVVLPAAQAGHAWAIRCVWESLAPAVAAYARRRGAGEPDDLTSEVFLSVFRDLSQFVGDEAGLRAYVFTIAHRRVMDDLRRQYRRPAPVPLPRDAEPDSRHVPSAEDEALRRIGSSTTRALLDELAPDQRDVLVLRVLGDLTVDEAAQVLGKSPTAVKALQRRALEALRRRTSPVRAVPTQPPRAMTESR